MKHFKLYCLLLLVMSTSCIPQKLLVSSVSYQSIRNEHTGLDTTVPQDARILVRHQVSSEGELDVYIMNLTDSTMIIDRTMSFFVNSDGMSVSYYDPTIQTTTTTDMTSQSKGATVNLGAVANAIGVDGIAGRVLSGVNVGGSTTGGTSVSNTTYIVDQPVVAIGPKGQISMSRIFKIDGVGIPFLKALSSQNTSRQDLHIVAGSAEESVAKFTVVIAFSVDGGKHFENVVTEYYTDLLMSSYVKYNGNVNASLRDILYQPDVLKKVWSVMFFETNANSRDVYQGNNSLFDYK